jgi:hypothetical protein
MKLGISSVNMLHTGKDFQIKVNTKVLGLINQGEKIPKRNLVNRLLDLIKGTDLITQE